jgi:hypothetical protein
MDKGYETIIPGAGSLPDGQWLVVNRDGRRWEFPIEPIDEGRARNDVASRILDLDADVLWQQAIDGADMNVSPTARLLELIALAVAS